MRRFSTRVCALAILVFLIVAQVHAWVEAGPARNAGHACQFCVSGAWAIVSATPALALNLLSLRLQAEPPHARAKNQQAEASAPRAPPLT